MRFVFTDGWNSSWHVLFGMMAYYNLFGILLFAYYQFILKYDYNSAIDFAEFLVGYSLLWVFYSTSASSAPSAPSEPEETRAIQKESTALLIPSDRTRHTTRRAPRPL
jgi:Na+/H+-dicarboxylate symporter